MLINWLKVLPVTVPIILISYAVWAVGLAVIFALRTLLGAT